MHFTINPYALILSVSGLATIIMSIIIYTRLKAAEKSFALVIGLAGWWAATYGGELFSSTLPSMLFWLRLEYVGIAMLGPALLLFIRVFISNQKIAFRPYYVGLLLIPVVTVILVCTNDSHHYFYKSLSVDDKSQFPLLVIKPAFFYYIFTVNFYITLVWCIYALLTAFKRVDRIYRKQKNIILYALVIPWVFNILYKFGIRPNQNIDLTPFAFIATSGIISFGLLRYKLLDIIPAAREKIFESMQDGVLVLNAFDRIIDNNNQMQQVLSLTNKELIGSTLIDLFPFAEQLYVKVLERRKQTLEIELNYADEKTYYKVDINVLFGRVLEYNGCILIFHDITQSKKDEISLIALNGLKDRLFSIIAHDLRSPLINIMDLIKLTDEQVISADEFRQFLPELSKNLNYTSSLLDNLLHWSKSQLKGEKINVKTLDMQKMVKHEIFYYEQKAKEKGILIKCIMPGEMWVYADAEMLQLVLRNLIGNAIKYCSKQDEITVSASVNLNQETMVCIEDSGCGMKPETVEKLFMLETFTTRGTNNEQGTGLGLQLCKDFVEKNNGKIWVKTELGKGSKFCFTIPSVSSKKLAHNTATV